MVFLGIFFSTIILGHSTDFNEKVIIAKILDLEVRIPNTPLVSLVLTIFISINAFSRAHCKSQVKSRQSVYIILTLLIVKCNDKFLVLAKRI